MGFKKAWQDFIAFLEGPPQEEIKPAIPKPDVKNDFKEATEITVSPQKTQQSSNDAEQEKKADLIRGMYTQTWYTP